MEQKEIHVRDIPEVELKALIYDQMGVRENANRIINMLKEELDRRVKLNADAAAEAAKKATDAVAKAGEDQGAPVQSEDAKKDEGGEENKA